MESLVVGVVLIGIAILAGRFGGQPRPVERSGAYRQALIGTIREPRTLGRRVAEPSLQVESPVVAHRVSIPAHATLELATDAP